MGDHVQLWFGKIDKKRDGPPKYFGGPSLDRLLRCFFAVSPFAVNFPVQVEEFGDPAGFSDELFGEGLDTCLFTGFVVRQIDPDESFIDQTVKVSMWKLMGMFIGLLQKMDEPLF